jgi:hypothetical protein
MNNDKVRKNYDYTDIDPFDLEKVAMASSLQWRFQESVSAIDAGMRNNYDILRTKVSASLRPIIVVQFDFAGGTYNLLTNEGQITVQPVPRLFEQIKSICHCPLGIYTILAPYLTEPRNEDWIRPLNEFGQTIQKSLDCIEHSDFPRDVRSWSEQILVAAHDFVQETVKKRSFGADTFRDFTASVFDSIHQNMRHAASLQVKAVTDLLGEWKKLLGEEEWRNLYTVVLTTWTIEEKNQHWLVLRKLMDQQMLDQRLYVVSVGSARENTVDIGVMNLATIVQDKIAGDLVFGNATPEAERLNTDLATRNDLLSSSVEEIVGKIPTTRGNMP